MKTIHPSNPHLRQRFAVQVILPQLQARPPKDDHALPETATHDFLVLTARPDLTPEHHKANEPVNRV
jgi:hypothetical protein